MNVYHRGIIAVLPSQFLLVEVIFSEKILISPLAFRSVYLTGLL